MAAFGLGGRRLLLLVVVVLSVAWTRCEAGSSQDQYNMMAGLMAPVDSAQKLAFLRNAVNSGSKGLDPVDMMRAIFKSDAFKAIKDNVEVQHRILESVPLLASLAGFREAAGRRLGDEETKRAFLEGVEHLLLFGKDAINKTKDPASIQRVINRIGASTDPHVQALMKKATDGDDHAATKLQKMLSEEVFPGVDLDVAKEVVSRRSFDTLLSMPELMHYVDKDKHMSSILRGPLLLDKSNKKAE